MIIRIWYPYIVFSCVVIPCFFAKPFSLNEAIAAEEKQKLSPRTPQSTPRPKLSSETPEKIILNKPLKSNPLKSKKLKAIENILPRGKKILSSLKYRKKFQIRSPLKPKKLKYLQKTRNKRKNKSIKRQINEDEKLHRKYMPLLRSLSMLFDNLAGDYDESDESGRNKYKKHRYTSNKNSTVCSCTNKSDTEISESPKEAIATTTPLVEVSTGSESITTETSAPTTYHTTTSDVGSFRPDSDVPVLFTRNTASPGGNYTGFSERSRPAFYPSDKGDITRNHRDGEYNTGSGQNKTSAKHNEKDPNSTSRNSPDSDGFGGRLLGDRISSPNPVYRGGFDETDLSTESEKSIGHTRGDFIEFEGQNKFEVGRNESEGSKFLQEFVRGDRRNIPEYSIVNNTESLQPQEGFKEGYNSIAVNIADDKRLTDRSSASPTEDQETSSKNSAVISISDLNNPIIMLQNSPKHKAPYVTIIDGYSVARDKNGANKLAEQSIRFHSIQ